MATKAFIDGDGKTGLPMAAGYYANYPVVVTGKSSSITVDRTIPVFTKKFSLSNLVDLMLAHVKNGDNVVICCHGAPGRIGIYRNSVNWLWEQHLDLILSGKDSAAGALGMEPAQYAKFLEKLDQIVALRIQHLAIRACNVGKDRGFTKKLGILFGAKSVSAPTLRTAYITADLGELKNEKDLKRDYKYWFPVPLSLPQYKFVIASRPVSDVLYETVLASDSHDGAGVFLADNFHGVLRPYQGQKNIHLHGWCVPGSPGKFYFPKDPRYTSHIAYISNCGTQ